jgi:type IV pilus assembly protein PilX
MLILNKNSQQGVALIVSLVMLLIMTLLAVSSMNTTILEEKMAGNYKDRNMAFQASEAGLRAGETYLRTTPILPPFDGTTAGLYQPTSSGLPKWQVVNWAASGQYRSYTANLLSNISSPPNYIIEELQPVNESGGSLEAGVALESRFYRITSNAVGGTDTAIVMLQSTYKR